MRRAALASLTTILLTCGTALAQADRNGGASGSATPAPAAPAATPVLRPGKPPRGVTIQSKTIDTRPSAASAAPRSSLVDHPATPAPRSPAPAPKPEDARKPVVLDNDELTRKFGPGAGEDDCVDAASRYPYNAWYYRRTDYDQLSARLQCLQGRSRDLQRQLYDMRRGVPPPGTKNWTVLHEEIIAATEQRLARVNALIAKLEPQYQSTFR